MNTTDYVVPWRTKPRDGVRTGAAVLALVALAMTSGCVVAPLEPRPAPMVVQPGPVYVAPTYVSPGMGWLWEFHSHYGWGWHHPQYGWHQGWR